MDQLKKGKHEEEKTQSQRHCKKSLIDLLQMPVGAGVSIGRVRCQEASGNLKALVPFDQSILLTVKAKETNKNVSFNLEK